MRKEFPDGLSERVCQLRAEHIVGIDVRTVSGRNGFSVFQLVPILRERSSKAAGRGGRVLRRVRI
jgi:hypothetical protein